MGRPATYAMLKQMSEKEGQNIPGYLSTHPDPGAREAHTRDLADKAVAARPGTFIVQTNEYKRSLQDLLYGDDPREGYLEGSRFYHPGLHFQLDFPEGWQVENGRATISAGVKGGAAMQLGIAKADASPGGYPAALQKAGKITSAAGQTESIGGYPAWSGVLTLPDGQGGTRQMLAVWIQREAGQLYQFLGGPASDAAGRAAFFASARSLRNLTDPAKLVVYPNRLDIRLADGKSSLFKMLKDVPTVVAGESDVAWLNGIEAGSKPKDGFLLKVPRKVR